METPVTWENNLNDILVISTIKASRWRQPANPDVPGTGGVQPDRSGVIPALSSREAIPEHRPEGIASLHILLRSSACSYKVGNNGSNSDRRMEAHRGYKICDGRNTRKWQNHDWNPGRSSSRVCVFPNGPGCCEV